MFPAGGHLESDQDLPDSNFKGNNPRTIVTNWPGGFRGEDLWMCFQKDSYLIPRPPSWDDRNYSYGHQLYPSELLGQLEINLVTMVLG
jgi:hypothetical protein